MKGMARQRPNYLIHTASAALLVCAAVASAQSSTEVPASTAPVIKATFKTPKIVALVDKEVPTNKDGSTETVSPEDWAKLKELSKTYQKVARDNYALIIKSLKLENAPAPTNMVRIVVTYKYGGVAATSGSGFGGEKTGPRIEVSAKYALAHPKDLGMIVHEMVHVVQSYPNYDPGWLVEGIADWVRWFNYEDVDKRPHPKAARAHARDAYQTTGAFLSWATGKYDADLVPKLNAALQKNVYKEDLFKEYTGKTLDELDAEWKTTLP